MKPLLLILSFSLAVISMAQKKEELFNYQFKPSKSSSYYYVVTEKEENAWHRKAYYISHKMIAMEGWYKDESCKVANGDMTWYHPTRYLKSQGRYVDGKKEGTWLEWNDKGQLIDSSAYKEGRRIGISMRWHSNGMLQDSMEFDSEGNGVEVAWHDDGSLYKAGRWMQDTLKKGRWKYYHKNGQTLATEDYENGRRVACACYDEQGVQLDSLMCTEKEAEVVGGKQGMQEWRRFLERSLQSVIAAKARVLPMGEYTVLVRFMVEKDGTLSNFQALTNHGHGLEEEVIRMFKYAPRWSPGQYFGRPVRSYHTQPITFMIQGR
jgi:antitoxin component YwqK of YwqJK toxin-antitoxin module